MARSLSRAIIQSPLDVDETIVRVLREEFYGASSIPFQDACSDAIAESCRAQGDPDANAGVILLVKQEEDGEIYGKQSEITVDIISVLTGTK